MKLIRELMRAEKKALPREREFSLSLSLFISLSLSLSLSNSQIDAMFHPFQIKNLKKLNSYALSSHPVREIAECIRAG